LCPALEPWLTSWSVLTYEDDPQPIDPRIELAWSGPAVAPAGMVQGPFQLAGVGEPEVKRVRERPFQLLEDDAAAPELTRYWSGPRAMVWHVPLAPPHLAGTPGAW
jgi:hypothetical protein